VDDMGKYAHFEGGKLVSNTQKKEVTVTQSYTPTGETRGGFQVVKYSEKEEKAPWGIKTFEDALEWYGNLRMMRHDLPDGQWQELKEAVRDYVSSYGKDTKKWPEDAKESFKEDVIENLREWA